MKKNDYRGSSPAGGMGVNAKMLSVCKLLLLCVVCCIITAPASAQNKLLDVSYADVAVVDILNDLKARTGYGFFYNKDVIPESMKATVTMSNASLMEILNKILTDNNLDYKITNDNVIIGPESQKQTIAQSQTQKPPMVSIQVRVTDKDKMPMPNVSVKIKDKPHGTVTNREGMAAILMPAQDNIVVVFSFTGMKKQEIAYTGQNTINVMMEEDVINIQKVVVTGYAEIPKESFTGSATLITQEELQNLNRGNVINSLSVLDPSFRIAMNNLMGSDPNTIPDFFIRGRTGTPGVMQLDAMNAANTDDISQFALQNNPSAPIFILDGFEVSQTKIYDLDMNRIESITILKDAAATAVYGSRAGNGVIVIQTIPPQPGEVQITYSGKLTATFPDLTSYDLLNSAEVLEAERLAGVFDATSTYNMSTGVVAYMDKLNLVLQGIDTDWISKPLRSSYNHQHAIFITGGSQELRYGLDLSYKREDGVMKGSFRNTTGAALTVDYRWRSLQVKNKVEVNRMTSEDSPYGEFSTYVKMKPYLSPYNAQGDYQKKLAIPNATSYDTEIANPLYESTIGNFYKNNYTEIMDYLSLIWRSPNAYWMVRGNLGISFKLEDANKFTSPFSATYITKVSPLDPNTIGRLSISEVRTTMWNGDISLNYARNIGGHNIHCRLSGEASETKATSFNIVYQGFVNNIASPAQAIEVPTKPTYRDSNVRRLSAFIQGNYSYRNVYLVDISGRLDGSSVFGTDQKTAPFWSTGIGLNIHNYDFMAYNNWLNLLKLTATYGQTGKVNFQSYQAKTTYEAIINDHYATSMGIVLKAFGNTDLRWEKSRTWNYKIELGLMDNALNMQFEYYRIRTIDLVEDVSIPSSSGFTVYKSNIGEVMNEGYELGVSLRLLRNHDWNINVINQVNHNTNKIVKIGDALENYNQRIDDFLNQYNSSAIPFTKYEEGNSLSAIYGMKSLGIDPADGRELFVYRDGSVSHNWDSSEQQVIGDTEPKISGSLQLNIKWKQLELYAAFLYRWGGQAYNQTYQEIENVNLIYYSGDRRILIERWAQVGDVTPLKNIASRTTITRSTSRFVQDDNTFQFSSISLIYSINREWLKRVLRINSAKITLNTTDLATLSTIKQERGTTYPFARSFNLNLYVQF